MKRTLSMHATKHPAIEFLHTILIVLTALAVMFLSALLIDTACIVFGFQTERLTGLPGIRKELAGPGIDDEL